MSKLSYNREEAAAEIGISVDKLDLERKEGKICAKYVGNKPVYQHEELKRWLESLPSEPKSA